MIRKNHFSMLFLLAACQASEKDAGDSRNDGAAATKATRAAVETARLTGLYIGGAAGARNQLCVIDEASGNARFGMLVQNANKESCSGSGAIMRVGNRLDLVMAGRSSCTISARIENGVITLSAPLPTGCDYYCGSNASMAGAKFRRIGRNASDAMRAKDLVGEPLCADIG